MQVAMEKIDYRGYRVIEEKFGRDGAKELVDSLEEVVAKSVERESSRGKDTVKQELRAELASKADIAQLEGTTKSEIARLEGTMKSEIARVEGTMKSELSRVEARIAVSESRTIRAFYVIGLLIVGLNYNVIQHAGHLLGLIK